MELDGCIQRQKPLLILRGNRHLFGFGLYSVPVVDEVVGPTGIGMRDDGLRLFEQSLGHIHPAREFQGILQTSEFPESWSRWYIPKHLNAWDTVHRSSVRW